MKDLQKWQQTTVPKDKSHSTTKNQNIEEKKRIYKTAPRIMNEKSTNYLLWQATAKVKRPITHIPPLGEENGRRTKANPGEDKAFAKRLKKVYTINGITVDQIDKTI